jgi:protein-disulfide isomerase
VPVSVAQCIQEKRACKRCIPAAKFLVRQVRDGRSRKQIDEAFHNRFDPAKVKNVELGNAPIRGPSDAPITIVEFADFECPVCGATFPLVEKLLDVKKDKIRFAYKFLALPMHKNAEPAAKVAIAAIGQNKFWEMHHKLFENQTRLSGPDLDGYARDLGLDVVKLKTDAQSKETTERMEADKKQADMLGVRGTPTIYINGREYDRSQDMLDWVNMELDLMDVKSAPAPTATDAGVATVDAAKPAATPDAGKK